MVAGIATTGGLWLFETGLFWEALVKTGAATSVGILLSALVVPFLLILVPAGVLADRVGPKPLLLVSQLAWVAITAGLMGLAYFVVRREEVAHHAKNAGGVAGVATASTDSGAADGAQDSAEDGAEDEEAGE